jgi:type II secretory pathway pseudopilin PulG
MRTFFKKPLNSNGDTIVEVLIVLAVLGFAFSISMATANKGLSQSRNAEEHSQALSTLNSQIELTRAAIANKMTLPVDKPFCITSSDTVDQSFPAGYTVPGNASLDQTNLDPSKHVYPDACTTNGLYFASVVLDSHDNYIIRVRWPGSSSLGVQQEIMTYRTHTLDADASSGVPLEAFPSGVTVRVGVVQPNADGHTIDCSKDATGSRDQTTVSFSQDNGGANFPDGVTDSSSAVSYTENIVDNGRYTSTIKSVAPGRAPAADSSYGICPGFASGSTKVSPGQPATINLKIYPKCVQHSYNVDETYTYTGPPYYHSSQDVYRTVDTSWWGDGGRRGDLDGFSLDWGPEIWVANGQVYYSGPGATGVDYRRTYIGGRPYYLAWDWVLHPDSVQVYDHTDYWDYYGDTLTGTRTVTKYRWDCPN